METPVDPPVFVIGTNSILGVVAALFLSAVEQESSATHDFHPTAMPMMVEE